MKHEFELQSKNGKKAWRVTVCYDTAKMIEFFESSRHLNGPFRKATATGHFRGTRCRGGITFDITPVK